VSSKLRVTSSMCGRKTSLNISGEMGFLSWASVQHLHSFGHAPPLSPGG
jgi:hypothetical protein